MLTNEEVEKIEIELLLEAVYRKYGYDFRNYSFPSIRRRILYSAQKHSISSISEFQGQILYKPKVLEALLNDISITVTEMFRHPNLFKVLREKILPTINDIPHIRIWVAGCSSGEEVYSLAILLYEEGLLEKSRIYATDINEKILIKAKNGRIALKQMRQYTKNYQDAAGKNEFSNYYLVRDNYVEISPFLRKNVVFAQHNLVTDQSFNEFHLILCRNVLIYFNEKLKERVYELFYNSLNQNGVLGLGSKESMCGSLLTDRFKSIHQTCSFYQKI